MIQHRPGTVVHFVESADFGGTEQSLLHLLSGLDRRRWRPMVWHYPAGGLSPLLEGARRLDVETRTLPKPLGRSTAATLVHLVRALRAERPTVFHAHLNWPLACREGLLAAAAAHVPAITATAQLFMDRPPRGATWLQRLVIAPRVGRFLAVSREVARQLQVVFAIPPRNIRVVYNGIPTAMFDRGCHPAIRAAVSGSPERTLVMTTARLDAQKGLSYLLAAAARVPEALFVIAGDGPERAMLAGRSRELGVEDRVLFLGYRSDVADLLASCDLFVLPSLFEGLPLSILEAMAAGKPVIASAIGGTAEAVVDGETGLLVPACDPAALAVAIRSLLADPDRASRMGAAGRARAERHFSAETMVKRVTDVYDELLVEAGGRAHH